MSIVKSFRVGDSGEIHVVNIFSAMGIKAVKNLDSNTRADYDLDCELDGIKFTCEVKNDIMAEKTGNVAFEYFNSKSNKPSGIYGTKADIWIHLLTDDEHIIVCLAPVKTVRKYVKDNAAYRNLKSVGDDNADILLYKVDEVLQLLFKRIDNISNEDAIKLIKKMLK